MVILFYILIFLIIFLPVAMFVVNMQNKEEFNLTQIVIYTIYCVCCLIIAILLSPILLNLYNIYG
jgi:uncharacterized protein with PQ loop repeat